MWTYIINVLKNNKLFNELFENPKEVISLIKERWSEPHRHYHNVEHLYNLIKYVDSDKILTIVASFHDIIYNPMKKDNEEKSIDLFKSLLIDEKDRDVYIDSIIKAIETIILDTKTGIPTSRLSKRFQDGDRWYLNTFKSDDKIKKIEEDIYNEYKSFIDYSIYIKERIKFLKSQIIDSNKNIIDKHIDFLEKGKLKRG